MGCGSLPNQDGGRRGHGHGLPPKVNDSRQPMTASHSKRLASGNDSEPSGVGLEETQVQPVQEEAQLQAVQKEPQLQAVQEEPNQDVDCSFKEHRDRV